MGGIREGILNVEQSAQTLLKWVLFLIMGTMTGIVLLGVLFRYVLVAPLPWSEELARYLMVWGASLGASVAFREGSHIAVTMLVDKLHGLSGKIILKVTQIIVFVFMAVVMVEGFMLAFKVSSQESPAMEISMAWPYLSIPIGCLFIVFEIPIMMFFPKRPVGERGRESL
jgi:TRAP-type C4-dicarboxylate transport system permease small subunit